MCMTSASHGRRAVTDMTEAQREMRRAKNEKTKQGEQNTSKPGWGGWIPKFSFVGSSNQVVASQDKSRDVIQVVERADLQKLPPGWEAKFDSKSSKYFYVNHSMKLMSWVPPDSTIELQELPSKGGMQHYAATSSPPQAAKDSSTDGTATHKKKWEATRTDWVKPGEPGMSIKAEASAPLVPRAQRKAPTKAVHDAIDQFPLVSADDNAVFDQGRARAGRTGGASAAKNTVCPAAKEDDFALLSDDMTVFRKRPVVGGQRSAPTKAAVDQFPLVSADDDAVFDQERTRVGHKIESTTANDPDPQVLNAEYRDREPAALATSVETESEAVDAAARKRAEEENSEAKKQREAAKKAEKDRLAAEAEARKKAEERKRQAEEEERAAAEGARKKAEQEARAREEEKRREAAKKAEKERLAAEAEARKKAEERKRQAGEEERAVAEGSCTKASGTRQRKSVEEEKRMEVEGQTMDDPKKSALCAASVGGVATKTSTDATVKERKQSNLDIYRQARQHKEKLATRESNKEEDSGVLRLCIMSVFCGRLLCRSLLNLELA